MKMTPAELSLVCRLVLRRSGIVLDEAKTYLVESRMGMLARKRGCASISEMLAPLAVTRPGNEPLEQIVTEAMTTNETSFFRDLKPFQTLCQSVLPGLIERRAAQRTLSIWCAASSTGQEPYTIAMSMLDAFPQLANWKVTFVASDLSRDVLEKARAGRYSQLEVSRGLPATLLVKHFRKVGLEWEVAPQFRSMIDFREINLLGDWPAMAPLDVCFIRNVLIYFDQPTKRKILGRIHDRLRPDGYLFLGAAETTLSLDERFERLQMDSSGCYRLRAAAAAGPVAAKPMTIGTTATVTRLAA